MIKKFLMNYYKYRLHKLVEAYQNEIRYNCLYGYDDSLRCIGLMLQSKLQEFYLEFYKSFLPKRWINENSCCWFKRF
jgi:hypothetical protein